MSLYPEEDGQIAAYVRRRMADLERTAGIPAIPGTDLAADVGDLRAKLLELDEERKAIARELADLRRQGTMLTRSNVRALASAIVAGEPGEDMPSAQEIRDRVEKGMRRAAAIAVAETEVRKDVARQIRAKQDHYEAELRVHRQTPLTAFKDAIDQLESAAGELLEYDAAIDWVHRGATGTPSPAVPTVHLAREPNFAMVLAGLRAMIQDKPEPRPTTFEDGTSRTGWNAWGKLANGEVAVGDLRTRPANDALRAEEAAGRPAKAAKAVVS